MLQKVAGGITGLDQITGGGLPDARMALVCGRNRERAVVTGIVATRTLVRHQPLPLRCAIGDMPHEATLRRAIEVAA